MSILVETRESDSPFIETVIRGRTVSDGSPVRPAETHWHLVVARYHGDQNLILVGPWTGAGVTKYEEGAEILWIKLKLGAFMPHLPTRKFLDRETPLPKAGSHSFWLNGSAWQFPDFENVETFIDRLVREDTLVRDPVVGDVLQGRTHGLSARTVRYRFRQATGLSQSQIFQYERAQKAAGLLQQGVSILDTVFEAGYYDQPHLTRSLKHWTGHTPGQLVRPSIPVANELLHRT